MSDMNNLGLVEVATIAPTTPSKAIGVQRGDKPLPPSGKDMPPQEREVEPKQKQLETAVTQIANHVQNISRDLQFLLDNESGRTVLKVLDSESQEVVRQIPSEEMLVLSRKIRQLAPEVAQGLLLQREV